MRAYVVHAEAEPGAALPIERTLLAAAGATLVCAGSTDIRGVAAAAHDCDVLLSELVPIPRTLLAAMPRCQAVVSYSIGLDHVDLDAASELGIIVAHTPGFCVDEVSNHTLLFVLACARRLVPLDRRVRAGWWPDGRRLEAELLPIGSLRGERLGLVGFGAIAQMVAQKAAVFGLDICAFDPLVPDTPFAAAGVTRLPLAELLATSDYVSLHVPLLPSTRHLLGAAELAQMKPGAFLVNTARGGLVDEEALLAALAGGRLAGAALDVFEQEPLTDDHPLLRLPNVIVTPHSAYCSGAAYERVRRMAATAVVQVLRGEWPAAVANPQVRGRSRMERQGG
jgi:D-3-phosphoglycerate dehydrogenase